MCAVSLEFAAILAFAFALASIVYLERRPSDPFAKSGTVETGSGFVIASSARETFILTAAHVLGCDTYGSGCDEELEARFADDPGTLWHAKRAYSGAALTNDDMAIVVVERGNVPALRTAAAKGDGSVTVVGFPQSLVESAHGEAADLRPRPLSGTVASSLRDERLLLNLSTEHGDSGAPVLDASGNAVALVQGRSDASHDIAVAGASFLDLVSLVSETAGSERGRAELLTRNALHWEALRKRYYTLVGQQELQKTEDVDFGDAIGAGSLDAARRFLRLYGFRAAVYQPSVEVTRTALSVAKTAADAGDAGAAYDIHTFLQPLVSGAKGEFSELAVHMSADYFERAVAARYPYALLELSGKSLDPGVYVPLQREAMPGLARLAAAGDAQAALDFANLYALQSRAPDVALHDPATPENYLRALRLGAYEAVSFVLIYRNQLPDPATALMVAEDAARHDWMTARDLGDIYAEGKGVERDAMHALDLYALSYLGENYQPKLNALAPEVGEAYASIKGSPAFAAAQRAVSFVEVENINDSGYGVTLSSDGRHSIVAVSSSLLHCDAYERNCRTSVSVRFDGAHDPVTYQASIAYSNGNTLEFGVALLDVPAPREPTVRVAESPGKLVFTLDNQFGRETAHALVGLLRGIDDRGHVVRCDVPWAELGGPNAVFDLATGNLVGFANDPVDLSHATGPAAIRAALETVERVRSGAP